MKQSGFLLSFAIVASLWGLSFAATCTYSEKYTYSCWLSDAVIVEEDDEWEIIGKHKSCCGNDDLFFLVQNHSISLRYIPPKLTEQFPNINTMQLFGLNIEFGTENSLRYCSSLDSLDLSYNYLKIIQKGFLNRCSVLTYLDLAENQIAEIEVGAFDGNVALDDLYLGGNKLTTIKNNIFNPLVSLRRIFLINNGITSIEANAFNLPKLELLSLGDNKLTSFSQAALGTSQSLEHLYLVYNQLTAVPRLQLNKLWALTLRNNLITVLEDDIFHYTPELRTVEFQDNQIYRLEADPFELLTKLDTLWLQNNLIQAIEPDFIEKLPLLDEMMLANNLCVNATIVNIQEMKVAAHSILDRCYEHFQELV